MTEERRNEIAYILMEMGARQKRAHSPEELRREIGNFAKSTQIPVGELKKFLRDLIIGVYKNALS